MVCKNSTIRNIWDYKTKHSQHTIRSFLFNKKIMQLFSVHLSRALLKKHNLKIPNFNFPDETNNFVQAKGCKYAMRISTTKSKNETKIQNE